MAFLRQSHASIGWGLTAVFLVASACNQVAGLSDLEFGSGGTGAIGGAGGNGASVGGSGGIGGNGGSGGDEAPTCETNLAQRHAWSTLLGSTAAVDLRLLAPRSIEGDLVVVQHEDTLTFLDQTFAPAPNGHLLMLVGDDGRFLGAQTMSTPSEADTFRITAATTDSANNTYLAGQLSGDLVIDGMPTGNSLPLGTFLARLDDNFAFRATDIYPAAARLEVADIAVTGDSVWAAGVSIGNTPETGRLVRYENNLDGTTFPVEQIIDLEPTTDPSAQVSVDRIEVFEDGDLLISGRTTDYFGIVGDPDSQVMLADATSSVFVARLELQGTQIGTRWARVLGSNDALAGAALIPTQQGVAVIGHFRGNASFGEGFTLSASDDTDLFLAILDATTGQTMAVHDYPSPGPDLFRSAVPESNGILLVGTFDNELDFGSKTLETSDTAPFIAQLRLDGSVCFGVGLENAALVTSLIEVAGSGEILLGGNFSGTFSLGGPNLVSAGVQTNAFLGALRR